MFHHTPHITTQPQKNQWDTDQSHKNHLDTFQPHKREVLTSHHTPHTTTQPHKSQPGISHNQLKPQLTAARLTEAEPMEEVLTSHHMERRPTPQPHLTEVKLTEVRLTED